MTTYRVHFTDGERIDIDAETPDQARKIAKDRREGIVAKVKVVKEKADA